MTNACPHPIITVYLYHYPPVRQEPGEVVGYGICDECGKRIALDDIPEGAQIKDEDGRIIEL